MDPRTGSTRPLATCSRRFAPFAAPQIQAINEHPFLPPFLSKPLMNSRQRGRPSEAAGGPSVLSGWESLCLALVCLSLSGWLWLAG